MTTDTTTPAARLLAQIAKAEALAAKQMKSPWVQRSVYDVPQLAAALRECVTALEGLRTDTDPGKLTAEQLQYLMGLALDRAVAAMEGGDE